MRVIRPDTSDIQQLFYEDYMIFLGGSIENGKAVDWQSEITEVLKRFANDKFVIANPRRENWNPDLEHDTRPGSTFHSQVMWEIEAQENAALIVYYFAPDTMAPITLLELGKFGPNSDVVVCCPKEFWRRGNVELFCRFYDIPMVETFEDLCACVKDWAETEELRALEQEQLEAMEHPL